MNHPVANNAIVRHRLNRNHLPLRHLLTQRHRSPRFCGPKDLCTPYPTPVPILSPTGSPFDRNGRKGRASAHAPSPSPSPPTIFFQALSAAASSPLIFALSTSRNSSRETGRPSADAQSLTRKQSTACGHMTLSSTTLATALIGGIISFTTYPSTSRLCRNVP